MTEEQQTWENIYNSLKRKRNDELTWQLCEVNVYELTEHLNTLYDKIAELEKTKTPVKEAYKRVYGNYPITDIADTCWDNSTWTNFEQGYISAKKDYKVGEYQEPEEEPEELKTLYQMFCDKYWPKPNCDVFCDIVKEWMSQYTHNVMSGEYLKGYEECLTVLEENLK